MATKKKQIRLTKIIDAFLFRGEDFKYTAIYDMSAGSDGRYTLLQWFYDEPIVIGREVTMKDCRRIIAQKEKEWNDWDYSYKHFYLVDTHGLPSAVAATLLKHHQ